MIENPKINPYFIIPIYLTNPLYKNLVLIRFAAELMFFQINQNLCKSPFQYPFF